MCFGPAVIPPNEKAAKYVQIIRVMLVVQIVVVILNFVAAKYFLREAIFGIFFLFLLYIIQHQLSFQAIMFFIFISVFFAVYFMVYFLTPVQQQINFNTYSGLEKFAFADSIFSCAYYVFCFIFCFYPYRQFKSIEYGSNPILKQYFESQQREEKTAQDNNNADYDVDYGNMAIDQRKRNNDNGTFQVFKGQGVKIG